MQYVVDLWQLPPFGSIVGRNVDPFGLAKHVGILVPHLQWGAAVISFMPQGKVVQTVDDFTGGRDFDSVEYPSDLTPDFVVWRAQTAVIVGPYRLLKFNCDYFVRYCHGMTLESPQAQRATFFGLLALGAAAIAVANS